MTDALMFVLVLSAVRKFFPSMGRIPRRRPFGIALVVDLGALVGWLRRRWR